MEAGEAELIHSLAQTLRNRRRRGYLNRTLRCPWSR